jgi:hypothetical protein
VKGEVAVEGGHDGLEEGAEGGGASDAFARGLEENGIGGIELQDGFEFFGPEVLDPGLAGKRLTYQELTAQGPIRYTSKRQGRGLRKAA